MRERMSWSKRTAQDLMNQAKHFEAKMLKGYELRWTTSASSRASSTA